MNNLSKPVMRRNARRMVDLADAFGHLKYNDHGQTVEDTLNLSIPCARLVKAEVVTAVADTNDGVNDNALADVEHACANAVSYTLANGGDPRWRVIAEESNLDLAKAEETSVLNALWWASRNDHGPIHLHELENGLRATGLNDAERIRPILDRLVAQGLVVEGKSTFGAVWSRVQA